MLMALVRVSAPDPTRSFGKVAPLSNSLTGDLVIAAGSLNSLVKFLS